MFGKVFRIKSTASLGKHVAIEGILNIDTNSGGYLYLDGSLMSGTEIAFLDGVTAGTGAASKAFVADAYKAFRMGGWASAGAAGTAVVFAATHNFWSDGQLDILSVFGASTSNLTSAYSAKCARFRHLVSGSSITVAQETYGAMGQICAKGSTMTHIHGGLMGTFEGTGAAVVLNSSYTTGGHAGVISRIGGHANITCTTPLYGFLAWNNAGAAVASGTLAAYGTAVASTSYPWPYGFYFPATSVTKIGAITGASDGLYLTTTALTVGDSYSGFRSVVTAPAAHNEYGMSAYFDATITGTTAGHCYGVGSWINTSTTPVLSAGHIIVPFEGGVWTGEAQAAARIVFAGQHQAILTGAPASLHAWRLNSTQTITALIAAANPGTVGYTAGIGTSGTQLGYIPMFDIVGVGVGYIRIYDSAT